MDFRLALKKVAPPLVADLPLVAPVVTRLRRHGFFGDYTDFPAALKDCGRFRGYEGTEITDYAMRAALAFESGTTLDNRTARLGFALLSALRANPANGSGYRVLDFGGGFGLHHKALRAHVHAPLQWVVCETEYTVKLGTERFSSSELSFVSSLDGMARDSFDLVLASGSLQSLPNPYETLAALATRAKYLLIDRAPLTPATRDRLTVHQVNSGLRGAAPSWFFSSSHWTEQAERCGLRTVLEWDVPEDTPYFNTLNAVWRGFLYARS